MKMGFAVISANTTAVDMGTTEADCTCRRRLQASILDLAVSSPACMNRFLEKTLFACAHTAMQHLRIAALDMYCAQASTGGIGDYYIIRVAM